MCVCVCVWVHARTTVPGSLVWAGCQVNRQPAKMTSYRDFSSCVHTIRWRCLGHKKGGNQQTYQLIYIACRCFFLSYKGVLCVVFQRAGEATPHNPFKDMSAGAIKQKRPAGIFIVRTDSTCVFWPGEVFFPVQFVGLPVGPCFTIEIRNHCQCSLALRAVRVVTSLIYSTSHLQTPTHPGSNRAAGLHWPKPNMVRSGEKVASRFFRCSQVRRLFRNICNKVTFLSCFVRAQSGGRSTPPRQQGGQEIDQPDRRTRRRTARSSLWLWQKVSTKN